MKVSSSVKEQEDKIETLFAYRLIPWLLKRSRLRNKKLFYRQLEQLQKNIYALDTYLESIWDLKEEVLLKKWKKIFKALEKFGLSKKEQGEWCREIFVYQKQEIALRKKLQPTRLDISKFYFYKSCDVKLMRRLLYRADPELNKTVSYSDWIGFDYLTEVNDDIEDVFEDCEVYNCNRFLFALYNWGKSVTSKEYLTFIGQIQKESEIRLETMDSKEKRKVLKQTIMTAEDTRALLIKQLKSKQLKRISTSKVIETWNS